MFRLERQFKSEGFPIGHAFVMADVAMSSCLSLSLAFEKVPTAM